MPGEAVLAFYRARNDSDEPIIGVATYNVQPSKMGYHFVKIQVPVRAGAVGVNCATRAHNFFFVAVQCFCFDEQRLNPHEELDMPVLFFIDPAIATDKDCAGLTNATLAYTFFRSDDDEGINDFFAQDDNEMFREENLREQQQQPEQRHTAVHS